MVAPVVALAFPASQARQEVADVVELRVFGSKLDVIASLLFQHMHHNALDAHLYFPASQSKQPEPPKYCPAVQEREQVLTGWGLLLWGES